MLLVIAANESSAQTGLDDYVTTLIEQGMGTKELSEHLQKPRKQLEGLKKYLHQWYDHVAPLVDKDENGYQVFNENPKNKEVKFYDFGVYNDQVDHPVVTEQQLAVLLSELNLLSKTRNVSIGLLMDDRFFSGKNNIVVKAETPEISENVAQQIYKAAKKFANSPSPPWVKQLSMIDPHFFSWLSGVSEDKINEVVPRLKERLKTIEKNQAEQTPEQPSTPQPPPEQQQPETPSVKDPLDLFGGDRQLFENVILKDTEIVKGLNLGPAESEEALYKKLVNMATTLLEKEVPPALDALIKQIAKSKFESGPESWYSGERYFSSEDESARERFFHLQSELGAINYMISITHGLRGTAFDGVSAQLRDALDEMKEVMEKGLRGSWSLKALRLENNIRLAAGPTPCQKVQEIAKGLYNVLESLDQKYQGITSTDPNDARFKWELALLLGRARDLSRFWKTVEDSCNQAPGLKAASVIIAMPYVMTDVGITDLHWEFLGTGGIPRSYEDSVVEYIRERVDKIPEPFKSQISTALLRVDDAVTRDIGLKNLGGALIRYLSSAQGEADREIAVTPYDVHSERHFDEKMDRIKIWVEETRKLTQELGGTEKIKEMGPENVRAEVYKRVMKRIKELSKPIL